MTILCNDWWRFVALWQVKLWCDCPFWPDDGMCRLRDCSVCECPDSEFPELFKKPMRLSLDDLICQEGKPQAAVDRTLDSKAFRGWTEIDNPWTNDDETDNGLPLYVLTDIWMLFRIHCSLLGYSARYIMLILEHWE